MLELLAAELAAAAETLAANGGSLPGIPELLARLAGADGVHQTLLTGNLAANAAVKVAAFGLDQWLDLEIGAYGSDHADRRELVPIALERARRLRGVEFGAGRHLGGRRHRAGPRLRPGGRRPLPPRRHRGISVSDLAPLEPDVLLADLSDMDAVFKMLTS